MGILHKVPSGLPTGTTTGKVAGDDWRADHDSIPFSYNMFSSGTNAALGLTASATVNTEIMPVRKARIHTDLSKATACRMGIMYTVNSSAATSAIKLQYVARASEAATWAGTDTTVSVSAGTGTVNLMRTSGWVTLPVGAIIDDVVICAVVGTLAFGTTAPSISFIQVEFR